LRIQMHPKLKFPTVIFLVAFSLRISSASQIKLGEVLPEVNLTEFGKLNLEGEQISYVP